MSDNSGISSNFKLQSRIEALEKDVKRHQKRLEEHRCEIDFNTKKSGDLEDELSELKEQFEEREKHQFQDYFKIQRLEVVLRDSVDFSNLLLELFLNADIIDEDNHHRAYKEIKNMLEKLDSKPKTEKKEVDITNMVLKRCPYCSELFSLDVNTLVVRGSEASGGEKE